VGGAVGGAAIGGVGVAAAIGAAIGAVGGATGVATGGAAGGGPEGWVGNAAVGAAASSGRPQPPQKRLVGGFSAPQWAQLGMGSPVNR
jgi:hypothetical protein